MLFNLTLALLFGSGMPLCYLIVSVYLMVAFWWDRLNLLSWHQPAQRYSKRLPRAIMCKYGSWCTGTVVRHILLYPCPRGVGRSFGP